MKFTTVLIMRLTEKNKSKSGLVRKKEALINGEEEALPELAKKVFRKNKS